METMLQMLVFSISKVIQVRIPETSGIERLSTTCLVWVHSIPWTNVIPFSFGLLAPLVQAVGPQTVWQHLLGVDLLDTLSWSGTLHPLLRKQGNASSLTKKIELWVHLRTYRTNYPSYQIYWFFSTNWKSQFLFS